MKSYLHSVLAVVNKRAILKSDFAEQKAVRSQERSQERSQANNQFKQKAGQGITSSAGCHHSKI